MESKPKKRKVLKGSKAQAELPKPPKIAKVNLEVTASKNPSVSPEVLIEQNANLVESLFNSEAWKEIAFPLLQELIASVCGRFTNGRYYHGDFTRTENRKDFQSGYQRALMDFNNNLHDFILAKNKVLENKKKEQEESKAPIYNPFMEEENEETSQC